MGIGLHLHDLMMDWYFSQTTEKVVVGHGTQYPRRKFYRSVAGKKWECMAKEKSNLK
jgi:hypothetical protein